jgi:hypothetical protein
MRERKPAFDAFRSSLTSWPAISYFADSSRFAQGWRSGIPVAFPRSMYSESEVASSRPFGDVMRAGCSAISNEYLACVST